MRELIYRLRKHLALGHRLRTLQMRRELDPCALLPELRTFRARRSDRADFRINLVVYSLEASDRFGGIETSLALFAELGRFFPRMRIVVTATRPSAEAVAKLDDFVLVSPKNDAEAGRQVVLDATERTFRSGRTTFF